MSLNANAGLAPGAAVIRGNEIAAENSATPTTLPSLAVARARLLRVIRSRPAPQPDLFDDARWRRNSRGLDAQRILSRISRPHTANVAAALGCTPQSVNNWRAGRHSPTPANWHRLATLESLLVAAREYGRREVDPDGHTPCWRARP